jgi:osmotically-inducible protein OsmY
MDSRTADAVIDVIQDRHLVILQGQVDSVTTRRAATTIATRIPGVTAVNNELVVLRE